MLPGHYKDHYAVYLQSPAPLAAAYYIAVSHLHCIGYQLFALTDSAPEAAGAASSFFCFGLAFANELNRLLFSFFNGAGFAVGFDGGWLLPFCGGCFCSVVSVLGGSGLGGSFCKGRFAGIVVLEGALVDAAGGGGGRAPVLRYN